MNIYVGNLDRQASEVELSELFKKYGEVKSIKIVKDHTSGEPRGFAFVDMPDQTSATNAINDLNFKEFGKGRLKVNEAKPKNASAQAFNSFSSNFGYKDRFKF